MEKWHLRLHGSLLACIAIDLALSAKLSPRKPKIPDQQQIFPSTQMYY